MWDRSKGIIKPVVSGLAGAFGTPLLGAAVGGLMGGLDREGRRGIGFDARRGLRGGLEGYAAGQAGSFLGGRAGIQPLLGPNSARRATLRAVDGVPASVNSALDAANTALSQAGTASAAPAAVSSAVPLPTSRAGMQVSGGAASGGMMRGLGRVGSFVNNNANAVGMGLQGVSGILGAQSERRIAEERIALERERYEEERRRRENIARMLLPLYQQQAARFNP